MFVPPLPEHIFTWTVGLCGKSLLVGTRHVLGTMVFLMNLTCASPDGVVQMVNTSFSLTAASNTLLH